MRDAPSQTGTSTPKPAHTFEECSFPKYLHQQLLDSGFPEPTPVQAQGWPLLLSGRNVVAVAETGSGKTLAYALPAIMHVNAQGYLEPGDGPIVVVLAPTRELAIQISDVISRFGKSSKVRCVPIYGGAPRTAQLRSIANLTEICVATPGRLLDFHENNELDLKSRCTMLIIDEADRMLDLGFEPQIRKISDGIRPDRQTVLCTATWPSAARIAAKILCPDAAMLTVGGETCAYDCVSGGPITPTTKTTAYPTLADESKGVKHRVEVLSREEKYPECVAILENRLSKPLKGDTPRVLIFLNSKKRVDECVRELRGDGFDALAMHGDKDQAEREWVLREFRTGNSPVVCATDVAARGLDVAGVTTVVNYDAPNTVEEYAHRVGRTGRGVVSSVSGVTSVDCETYTFLCVSEANDWKLAEPLLATLAANGAAAGASEDVRAFAEMTARSRARPS